MKWRAEKLYNTDSFFDFWDKSDPYIKFIKIRDDNTYIEVKRTEVVQNNLNPSWVPIEIQLSKLVNPAKQSFKYFCFKEESKSGTTNRMEMTSS